MINKDSFSKVKKYSRSLKCVCASCKKRQRHHKSIVKSYLKQIKKQVDSGKMNSNTITNKIKPIKKLLRANEVDISCGTINQMLPIPTQSEDHTYKRENIQKMIK